MFRFANIQYLNFLYLIPALIILFLLAWYFKKRAIKQYGNPEILKQLMPEVSVIRPVIKFIFLLIALTSIIIGIARPQFGSRLKETKHVGVELVIALDVSNSMLAQDIKPNRLERARMAIVKMMDKLQEDRVGLIVFAGDAYVQIPITQDYGAAKMFLSSVNPKVAPKQGTAIGSAIKMAMKSFNFENGLEKAIIIITDGENHEDNPLEEAKKATEKGVKIHTIGIGSPEGAPIPIPEQFGQSIFRKDDQGGVIITRLDETILQQIAIETGGIYVRATNSDLGLQKVYSEINKMEKKEMESRVFSEYDDQFPYFFWIAFTFIILDFLLLERKNKFLSGIDIFSR